MSKTKELATIIAPGVAAGLLALAGLGAVSVACLPRAAAMAVVLLSAIAMISHEVDEARAQREQGLIVERARQ